MLLRVLDVLPTALLTAAAAVRALDLTPEMPPAACGVAELDRAVADFRHAWRGEHLQEGAVQVAARLVAAAEDYRDVEAVLVPRALR